MSGSDLQDTTPPNPPREPTDDMLQAIHSIHRPGWEVEWRTVWVTMFDAWAMSQENKKEAPDAQ